MRTQHQLIARCEVVSVILHKRSAARAIARHDFEDVQQGSGFPVAFAGEAVALRHQTLHRQARQLRHAVQRLEVGGKGAAAFVIEEALHAQLDARGVQHVLAFFAVDRRHVAEAILALILIDQRVDVAVADLIDHLDQIAHAPAVDRIAELDLRRDLIAFGDRHFPHIVAEARHLQLLAGVTRRGGAHPFAKTLVAVTILPVAGDHTVRQAHARADKAEFAAAVRSLVQVHKVHIHAVPRNFRVELGMEL